MELQTIWINGVDSMRKFFTFLNYYLEPKILKNKISSENIREYLQNRELLFGKTVLSAQDVNEKIRRSIMSGVPFMAGRFGATELSTMKTFDFQVKRNYEKMMDQMQMWSGFFPATKQGGEKFLDLMINSIPSVDYMGIWMLAFEKYYLKKYASSSLEFTYLFDLEPWSAPDNPWSSALEGKKVLVIHPFAETIEIQYKNREKLFPGTNILPKFELHTLKAVQTIAGEKDDRFNSWFEALEWMYQEAMKIDFDVAIIGCGAYGFPLAAKIKQAGKQSIHLAGATQLLFGIKGKRWDESDIYDYVRRFYNDYWVYPSERDKPKQAKIVEGGCYW